MQGKILRNKSIATILKLIYAHNHKLGMIGVSSKFKD